VRLELGSRLAELIRRGGTMLEWRRLQYDAVCAFVDAQRKLVALHGELISMIRNDRELYEQHRLESRELSVGCDSLRELIREIERADAGN
jgi:hypothetical protein